MVVANSKRLEVIPVKTTTALTTVQRLWRLFSRVGAPESIVSDIGIQFTAEEYKEFCRRNGIRNMFIAPYHLASNVLVERGVQTFKRGYKKLSEGTVEDCVARFVLQYATTLHTTTGRCPSELLLVRNLHTRLDTVKPDIEKFV